MPFRQWLRPPRQLLVVFLGVAGLSAGALVWLGWLLLKQDADLEAQRRQEPLEQAADQAVTTMQRAVADLKGIVSSPSADARLPADVTRVSIDSRTLVVAAGAPLVYFPVRESLPELPRETFAEGEQLEHVKTDSTAALRVYVQLAGSTDASVRAGALARVARVRRKLGDARGALQAYRELESIGQTSVEGLPASLVARAGRATLFQDTHRVADLASEAAGLQQDLGQGRWQLLRAEYDYYSEQAGIWLGSITVDDRRARARAEAADWLWQTAGPKGPALQARQPVDSAQPSATLLSGPVLAVQFGTDALVAGPDYVESLCAEAVARPFRCALSDSDDRTVTGDRPPGRMAAVRTASAIALPWTLHVSEAPDAAALPASPGRWLLFSAFGVVSLVLAAGWYFIARAMSRELRVARLQSDFVAAVSHEFRSPLTSLSHIAELLATNRLPTDEVRKNSYHVLVRETDRLRRLVEGLLDFGRFEAGAAALRLESVDVGELARTTVADFQQRMPDGYAVHVSDEGVNACVSGDREALSRALWNLLDNAVKYSPGRTTVWVSMVHDEHHIRIAVRDEGLGIPAHEQREVFDRFVRGTGSTARQIKGTGIGLAMVREIMRAHGGDVQLESEVDRGSTFTVVLPVANISNAEDPEDTEVREGNLWRGFSWRKTNRASRSLSTPIFAAKATKSPSSRAASKP